MRAATDLVALVRLEAVKRQLVLFRPDRHGFYSKLVGRAEHANGNFGAIGNENLGNGQNGPSDVQARAMLHPRRKFLTSCYRKFNFSCDCEMQFLATLSNSRKSAKRFSVWSCVKIKTRAIPLRSEAELL
ncbi:hypothetical protein LZK76_23880 [Rhizobium leguminosarum]|nr:hypothetical protein LZK76_23880 [Rhizobium leguminosarum]